MASCTIQRFINVALTAVGVVERDFFKGGQSIDKQYCIGACSFDS